MAMAAENRDPVALVTGAARRIGAAVASQLHEAGFRLVLHCHHSVDDALALCASMNSRRPGSAHVLIADLRKMEDITRLAADALALWGRMDALVNNASSFYPTPVGNIDERDWNDLIDTNLKSPLFLSQALTPALRRHKGCIVNMADVHAERPLAQHAVYCAAKAGNVMLTRSLAKDLAPDIRVNGIAPGAILWPQSEAQLSEERKQTIIGKIALARAGNPSDIARTVRFLVVDAPYITGQIIAVDGGRTLLS